MVLMGDGNFWMDYQLVKTKMITCPGSEDASSDLDSLGRIVLLH